MRGREGEGSVNLLLGLTLWNEIISPNKHNYSELWTRIACAYRSCFIYKGTLSPSRGSTQMEWWLKTLFILSDFSLLPSVTQRCNGQPLSAYRYSAASVRRPRLAERRLSGACRCSPSNPRFFWKVAYDALLHPALHLICEHPYNDGGVILDTNNYIFHLLTFLCR